VVSRVMTMAQAHLNDTVVTEINTLPQEFLNAMNAYKVNEACEMIWKRIGALDERIAVEKPFALIKTDEVAGKRIIEELVREVYLIGCTLYSIMPKTSELIKAAVRENKKPENLFPRKE